MSLIDQARKSFSSIIAPQDYDQFFAEHVSTDPLVLQATDNSVRSSMLGSDPKKVILEAFDQHAAILTCHAHSPTGPRPDPRTVSGEKEYHDLVREYHQNNYTVRIPNAGNLSPSLKKFTRALEILVGNPVDTEIFWSAAGGAAPVHFDNQDIIAIQILGTKRWFISSEQSEFPNDWTRLGEGPPELRAHTIHDVTPGDFIYMPRGTTHTVQSTSESIHLSIGFTPVTTRELVVAAIDHLADREMPLRANASDRADSFAIGRQHPDTKSKITEHLQKLAIAVQDPEFVSEALKLRQSKMIAKLPPLPPSAGSQSVHINSKVHRTDIAIANLDITPTVLDLCKPGDHILVHLGAHPALNYMLEEDEYRVSDIPGEIGDDIRIALTEKLMESGLLEIVE